MVARHSWTLPIPNDSIAICSCLTACGAAPDPRTENEIAALRRQIAELREMPERSAKAAPAAELGQQMLGLQIRHARLWAAGEHENWLLAQFQLAELNEALQEVTEQNGDHAALQPQRLAVVLPAIMKPAVGRLRSAIDSQKKVEFEAAYDGLSAACSACHQAAGHGFLVIQRPRTPLLDNLRAEP